MIVSKMGDSFIVRLPDDVVETLGLKEGDVIDVDVRRQENSEPSEQAKPNPDDWMTQMSRYEGTLPPGFKFNRDEANER